MKTNVLKWSRTVTVLTLVGFLGTFAAFAADPPDRAGRPGRGAGGGAGGGGQSGRGGLALDDSQREALREATQKNSDELAKLDEKLRAAQKELVHAALTEKQDEKVVREKAESVAKIQVEITVLRAKGFAAIAPTLKTEQRDQLENTRLGATMLSGGFGGPGAGFGAGGGGRGGAGGTQGDQPRRRRQGQ